MRILLDAGADPDVSNQDKHTALSLAQQLGFTAIADVLNAAGAASSANVVSRADKEEANQLIVKAAKWFNGKDSLQAKALYQQALEFNPNSGSAYSDLASIAWQFETELERADQLMRKAIESEPRNVEHIYWLGRINFARRKPEIYKPLFQKYVKLAPDTYNIRDLKKNYGHLLK